MNLFSLDSPIARFFYLVADIVTLHFLWLLCSLPLFTIGASTTALYYSCMKRIRTDEGHAAGNFFKAFKSNFRQATVIWLLLLLIGAVMLADLHIGMSVGGVLGKIMLVSCSVFLVPYILVCIYIFPIQAKFENRIADNLKNALLMPFQSFHYSLLLVFIIGTFAVLCLCFRPFIGLMLVCGVGLLGYLLSGIFVQLFRRYLPDELKQDAESKGTFR